MKRLDPIAVDARSERTRSALFQAFFELVLTKRYDDIRLADVLQRADVGRSTFYAHFANKDALLAESLAGPFGVLADAMLAEDNTARIQGILEHFWSQRAFARSILTGATRRRVLSVVVDLFESRIERQHWLRATLIAPPRLVAIQMAEAVLAPLTSWLQGEYSCDAARLATALRRSVRALAEAFSATGSHGPA